MYSYGNVYMAPLPTFLRIFQGAESVGICTTVQQSYRRLLYSLYAVRATTQLCVGSLQVTLSDSTAGAFWRVGYLEVVPKESTTLFARYKTLGGPAVEWL